MKPESNQHFLNRSCSKKAFHSELNISTKLRNSASKKSIVGSFAYCPKDIETLKQENFKLKEQINLLKAKLVQQKTLILSLQRTIAAPQSRQSISAQRSVNLSLKKDKFNLSKKLKTTQQQLNILRKQTNHINISDLYQQKQKYKHEVLRLRTMLVDKIRSSSSQSQSNLTQSLTKNKATSQSQNKFKSGFKQQAMIRAVTKEGKRSLLENISNNKINNQSKEQKCTRMSFKENINNTVLPYNKEYVFQRKNKLFASLHNGTNVNQKSIGVKRSFIF